MLRLNFCNLKIIHILHPWYHPKITGHVLKNKQKSQCAFIKKIMWLIILKMKMKMKNRSHKYHMNRPRSRHKLKNSKYKRDFSTMILICLKLHLNNMWSSTHGALAVKLKTAHKSSKLPTNEPQTSQTIHKLAKQLTNQSSTGKNTH